ncbi:DUF2332 domain-containing protein [Vitreimonas sp.]|uniref:DUF2332 domain-containing protein n=1 Tax=Vitreimonas sp. TaxID=3069702 RepID=UPI002EDA783B
MTWNAAEIREQIVSWTANRRGVSRLYEALASGMMEDEDLLQILAEAPEPTLFCNRFFGAVHYLLLQGVPGDLAAFYATVQTSPRPPAAAYPSFRQFCLDNLEAILAIIGEREIQISDVRRSAVLLPAIIEVSARESGRQLALIDVGACAGFNLNFDRYHYDYGVHGRIGDRRAAIQLRCEFRGARKFELPTAIPPIGARLGIDSEPVDPADVSACNWMMALISPDDDTRLQYLRAALAETRACPPPILKGTAGDLLKIAMSNMDPQMNLCVMHTMTSHHFTPDERRAVDDALAETSLRRTVHVVSLEWAVQDGHPDPTVPLVLELETWRVGYARRQTLGSSDNRGVGAWLEWGGCP